MMEGQIVRRNDPPIIGDDRIQEVLSAEALDELKRARIFLETPTLAVRLTNFIGGPIMMGIGLLPKRWSKAIMHLAEFSLRRAMEAALFSLDRKTAVKRSSDQTHRLAAIVSGAIGGAFGLPALFVELPISTTIMLRSIADIARSEGEPLETMEARLACLEVFAFGGRSIKDDASETGYYVVRLALGKAVTEAATHLVRKGLAGESAPVMIRLLSAIASRLGMVWSEKMVAMAIPLVGAMGGSVANAVFISHFQKMARGHFIIRRLERTWGRDVIERKYKQLGLAGA